MTPFFEGWMIEIKQYPREGDLFSVKDYFYYNSSNKEYGHRDTVIPIREILNKEEITESVARQIINSKIPIMRRVIDLNNQKESWIFDTNILEETKK